MSAQGKHTLWEVSKKYPDCFGFWRGDVFKIVGKVDRWDGWEDRVKQIVSDHNNLIAPDLLKALEELLEASERHIFSTECKEQRDAARSAIAKAKGGA